ncbi:hypothetical protein SAMN05444008_103159 [Cnuella takakiae]|uniref:Uncharacterized protein n=1 Tax=Cnuella takakiae TaxID=1302690 RepID=A0A1M4WVK4_9BACT|nr:hypothetical protein BUE76_06600 [Cnuella takakiae]SHE85321.1 hypothetical protein SAMN05444008_103159 [Cnuella takakiae]
MVNNSSFRCAAPFTSDGSPAQRERQEKKEFSTNKARNIFCHKDTKAQRKHKEIFVLLWDLVAWWPKIRN